MNATDRTFTVVLTVLIIAALGCFGAIVLISAPHIAGTVTGVLAGVVCAIAFIGVSVSAWATFEFAGRLSDR